MTSLLEQNARLAALEVLMRQLMIQHFRNVAGPAWKPALEDWKQAGIGVLADEGDTAGASYLKAVYDTLVPQIEQARSRN